MKFFKKFKLDMTHSQYKTTILILLESHKSHFNDDLILTVVVFTEIMDSMTGSGLMEEFELMKQSKYRVYMQNIDKALKNFEYSSEWADLISALGKLNKVIEN